MTLTGRLRAIVAALALLPCAPTLAQDAPDAPADDPAAVVERARKMIFGGRPAAALKLLRPLAERHPQETDVHFFRGMAAAATANLPEGRPGAPGNGEARRKLRDEAVASYRHILESRPGLAGARLELARVLFERGRCTAPPESLLEHLLGDDCDAADGELRTDERGGLNPQGAVEVGAGDELAPVGIGGPAHRRVKRCRTAWRRWRG